MTGVQTCALPISGSQTLNSATLHPTFVGVTSDFTNFNKVRIFSLVEDLADTSPFAMKNLLLPRRLLLALPTS